jgi:hypothetical protein
MQILDKSNDVSIRRGLFGKEGGEQKERVMGGDYDQSTLYACSKTE